MTSITPRGVRYRRGRDSPDGYFRDSFAIEALVDRLLRPFACGRPLRRRFFDYKTDAPVLGMDEDAAPDALLLIDGVFLHRDELRDRWDLSILLDVTPAAAERVRNRDGRPPASRYVRGQEIYHAQCMPRAHATLMLEW
jgi:uridine kinase